MGGFRRYGWAGRIYLTRPLPILTNYGITIGNLKLDFTDGEVRYKTSIDVEGDRLSHALLKRLVYIKSRGSWEGEHWL